MANVLLVGRDSVILDGKDITVDLVDGDVVTIVPQGALNNVASTYGGKMIVAEDRNGQIHTMTFRVMRGSDIDQWLQARYQTYHNDSPTFVTLNGSATQRIGDGDGNVITNTFAVNNAVFSQSPVNATINTNGSTEQLVRQYEFTCLIEESIG